ncbi:glucose-1-phosphate cytidylyltransferase [Actinobacteria bacterium IMCC25003]|nr:glucose-1-phosphate cytidylyltransferase [Actinobacteria bacterium IMCC25003]
MKVIILAGGLGTRISEETSNKPKPMVLLDDKPIIWHLMNIYARQGFTDFVVAAGYKAEVIRDWVDNLNTSWNIQVVDTGQETQTGGRISRCMKEFPNQRVMATYGDGLGNIDLQGLLDFHVHHGKMATVTAVRPPARFGVLESENGLVKHFGEKNQADAGWINGGFFVLDPQVSGLISSDSEPFETGALPKLVASRELMSFHHKGFWQPMDTLREKEELMKLASFPQPPWLNFESKVDA